MTSETKSELQQACDRHGIKLLLSYCGEHTDQNGWAFDRWTAVLRYRDRSITSDFKTGTGYRPNGRVKWPLGSPAHQKRISAADVLSSLLADAQSGSQTFDEWCSDLGHDSDSLRALNTYLECQRIGAKLRAAFPADLIEELSRLEH